MKEKELSPIYKQYLDIKKKHPDALILFRCGDFYETYGRDAKIIARVLGITFIKRSCQPPNNYEMAGFPHHALDSYLPKLVRNSDANANHHYGYSRVAICDQLEVRKQTRIADILTHKNK